MSAEHMILSNDERIIISHIDTAISPSAHKLNRIVSNHYENMSDNKTLAINQR